jgi:surfeit locus 1 family protein
VSAVRRLVWPGLATAIALAILLSLGFWQLARREVKERQLSGLASALNATPLSLDGRDLRDLDVHEAGHGNEGRASIAELTRVSITGVYLPDRSVPVRGTLPATKGGLTSGIGFFWMTPLQTPGGTIVFVNRGFVSAGGNFKPPDIPTPEGQVTVTGLMRKHERRGRFTPADIPAQREYFIRDIIVLTQAARLEQEKTAFFFIDAERNPGDLRPPVGVDPREMIARIPNNHLQYAVTWFAFAATLIGVFGFFARARLREKMEETL